MSIPALMTEGLGDGVQASLPTLFRSLSRLDVGATFQIPVFDRTLTYRVDQIVTVDPNDTDGADRVTVMTCTPLEDGSHRLIVRGAQRPTRQVEHSQDTSFPWWSLIFAGLEDDGEVEGPSDEPARVLPLRRPKGLRRRLQQGTAVADPEASAAAHLAERAEMERAEAERAAAERADMERAEAERAEAERAEAERVEAARAARAAAIELAAAQAASAEAEAAAAEAAALRAAAAAEAARESALDRAAAARQAADALMQARAGEPEQMPAPGERAPFAEAYERLAGIESAARVDDVRAGLPELAWHAGLAPDDAVGTPSGGVRGRHEA